MIIQGTNESILVTFENINDLPEENLYISLRNEIEEFKHWEMDDLIVHDNGFTFEAPITQEESMEWPEGPCIVEVKWIDHWENVLFVRKTDEVLPWGDTRILE